MNYTLRKNWAGLSPHMSVYDSEGARRFFVKGRWFDLLGTRYLLQDHAGKTLLEIVQDHTVATTSYSILENHVRIGSAGANAFHSHGFVDIDGIGRAEMALGHGSKTSFSLAGSGGVLAEITLKGMGWCMDVVKECNNAHLIAGLAVLYGQYLGHD